jgi:hypothetical protein
MGDSMTKLVSHCDEIVRLSISPALQHANVCPFLHSTVIPQLYELGVLYFQLVYLLED